MEARGAAGGLIIAAVCIIKRNRVNASRVRSETELQNGLPSSSKLTVDEIERFFPTVMLKDVKSSENGDEMSMNQMNKEAGI